IGLAFSLAACTSMVPVASSKLMARHLTGKWKSGESWMNIYCSGAIAYAIKPEPGYYFSQFRAAESAGGHVAEINDHQFIVGSLLPFTKQTFEVSAWPHQEEGELRMTVDGRPWTQASPEVCSD